MFSFAEPFCYDPTEPESQQWDTVYLLLLERETKQHFMRLLLALPQHGATGPCWLSPQGAVTLMFN
jgi:hypothetical protein